MLTGNAFLGQSDDNPAPKTEKDLDNISWQSIAPLILLLGGTAWILMIISVMNQIPFAIFNTIVYVNRIQVLQYAHISDFFTIMTIIQIWVQLAIAALLILYYVRPRFSNCVIRQDWSLLYFKSRDGQTRKKFGVLILVAIILFALLVGWDFLFLFAVAMVLVLNVPDLQNSSIPTLPKSKLWDNLFPFVKIFLYLTIFLAIVTVIEVAIGWIQMLFNFFFSGVTWTWNYITVYNIVSQILSVSFVIYFVPASLLPCVRTNNWGGLVKGNKALVWAIILFFFTSAWFAVFLLVALVIIKNFGPIKALGTEPVMVSGDGTNPSMAGA